MSEGRSLLQEAKQYHEALPDRIHQYLNGRGIPDALIERHLLGWNGWRITIPIVDREGRLAFFKLARDPETDPSYPKMLAARGAHAELYGWEVLRAKPDQIIICEGEFDRLVLEAHGFHAVTSTGGAGVFRPDWAKAFVAIPSVYVCYDRDEAGRQGGLRVGRLIPHAKFVELPEEVGDGGDVTDFFVRLGRSRDEFQKLLNSAQPVPKQAALDQGDTGARQRLTDDQIDRLKSSVAMENLIGHYIDLRSSGKNYVARCPFHEDRKPSFVVFPAAQSFYCFGCQASGDSITFLMRAEHLTFLEALKVLRQLSN